jgi:antitoxin (DNA-binding transcriptional repressor) of toxin-antitoxin stability system
MTVSAPKTPDELEELLAAAARGEEVKIELEGRVFALVPEPKQTRGLIGSMKGWKVSDDFDEPLEEMREYME